MTILAYSHTFVHISEFVTHLSRSNHISPAEPNIFPYSVQIHSTLPLNTANPRVPASVLFSSLFILAHSLISLSLSSPTCTSMPMILLCIILLSPVLLHLRNLLALPSNPVSLISVLGFLTTGCLSMTPKLNSCHWYPLTTLQGPH